MNGEKQMNAWKCADRFLSAFSWAIFGVQLLHVVAKLTLPGEVLPSVAWLDDYVMPVLLAGAVGYITNWLALWYLFRPYEPHFGGCIQGIIPRQKKQLAGSLGRMVGTKLLDPKALLRRV